MAQLSLPAHYQLDLDRRFGDVTQRMIGRLLGRRPRLPPAQDPVAWMPSIDVFSRDEDMVIRADLPDVDPQRDVDIFVQDESLVIRGQPKKEERLQANGHHSAEISYGSFIRTVPLPEGVEVDDVRASFDDGVLEVVVPRSVRPRSRKQVPIRTVSPREAGFGTSSGPRPPEGRRQLSSGRRSSSSSQRGWTWRRGDSGEERTG